MSRILGLDTGTNSLGWAVVDRNEDGVYSLVRKGSLIFQEGVKIEKGIESSKAAERTQARAVRKHYFRRRLRKIEVLKVLVKHHLCPYISEEDLKLWHTKKIYPNNEDFLLWQRTNENEARNPYHYRHICLNGKLDLTQQGDAYILGRALYHLAQRRGFLSNRLDANEENSDGDVKKGISDLSVAMEDAGCEYLGDYFYKLYSEQKNAVKIRKHYIDREDHYKKEFYAICEKQELPDETVKELERALYFQRPLKSQRQGVGKCTFEPSKPRCADSHPDYEEFRMYSLLNNIRIMGPYDLELRPLNDDEIKLALPVFYRKSKPNFDFEDIAKAIAGRNNYENIKENTGKTYKFNYRMSQSVSGCPTIAQFREIWGDDYKQAIAETYLLAGNKTADDCVSDIWNVLSFFSSKDKLRDFGRDKLQLDEEKAEKFSKIRLSRNFASLSHKAIRNILPFLKEGFIYSYAVLLAKIPSIIGVDIWNEYQEKIKDDIYELFCICSKRDSGMILDHEVKDYLQDHYDLRPGVQEKLYHPSMIETYKDAKMVNGVFQLGSPRTNAIRNPMAMRSLHQLRKVVNQLLKEGVIDQNTEVHIEYARELNDANKRKAIADYQKEQNDNHKKYREEIIELYREETGKDIEPTKDDILKYQLWEEQKHICLYTGEQIGIADFIGPNPRYDIEHTIPRSVGGDFITTNLTLCSSRFNRDVKRAQIPSQLPMHDEIMARIEPWKEKYEKLVDAINIEKRKAKGASSKEIKDKIIQKRHLLTIKCEYWKEKYRRFTMTEVPEGFARRQGTGIGLVSKYAGLYLKSLFHDSSNSNHSHVYVVKGFITSEFRKIWGLQEEYEKKSRDNHVHHCIDAITIACIGLHEYNHLAHYFYSVEEYESGRLADKPQFPKPWPTFTEDMNNLEKEILVVHNTPDNMPKQSRKHIKGKENWIAQGDTARGSLHNDTYYGAIERDGEIRYVVRRPLDSFEKLSDLDSIVDEVVKETIQKAVEGKDFKKAIKEPIYMNQEKGILIKKVRCFANSVKKPTHIRTHRDLSRKEYKQQYHVTNDTNYMLGIYEGVEGKKVKRSFEIVNMIDASSYFKKSINRDDYPSILPEKDAKELLVKYKLKKGLKVILLDRNETILNFDDKAELNKRLYIVTGLSFTTVSGNVYGMITMKHHQEARISKECPQKKGEYVKGEEYRPVIVMSHNQFHALIEGVDFEINSLGDIKLLKQC